MSEVPFDDAHAESDATTPDANPLNASRVFLWLNQPLRRSWCIIGWIVATIVFLALTALLGGPSQGDVSVSAYSTWSISHGHLACAYSPPSNHYFPPFADPYAMIAPLYPLLSGASLAVTHAWGSTPFPTTAQLGSNCSHALVAMYNWSLKSSVIGHTIDAGYLMWLPLLIGAILLLRAAGRGRTRWEPVAIVGLAVLPPVLECLLTYFHPQDILAIGLALCSLAAVLRGKWAWAGVMLGLAFLSNQFVLLIALPLVVVVPNQARIRLVLSGIVTFALIVAPLAIITSGRALKWSVLGSGYTTASPGDYGGTVLREVGLSPHALLLCARILPLVSALLLAWWAKRRLGDAVLNAVPLLSLVATTLAMRLVFEISLWGYYFAACAVLIVINDVVQGRIRGKVLAWLALFTLAYNPIPWGFESNGRPWGLAVREAMPNIFVIGALILILVDVVRFRVRWYVLTWFVLVCLTLVKDPFSHAALRTAMPSWFWQIVLVPVGVALAVSPLIESVKSMKTRVDTDGIASTSEITPHV
jgi:hypothetical protein